MEIDEPTMVVCKVLAMEESSYCYKACAKCETVIPEDSRPFSCPRKKCRRLGYSFKRLFRLVFTIAVEDKVFDAVCFDRNAQILFGCSADEFRDYEIVLTDAVKTAHNALVGERFQVTLCKATRTEGAQHLRMTKVVPLSSDFKPVIEAIKKRYKEYIATG